MTPDYNMHEIWVNHFDNVAQDYNMHEIWVNQFENVAPGFNMPEWDLGQSLWECGPRW